MKTQNLVDIYELSELQNENLYHYVNHPGGGYFHDNLLFMFKGKIDAGLFKRCWQKIVDRHTVFRTSFHFTKIGKPLQVVHRSVELPLEILDFSDKSEDETMKEIQRRMEEDRKMDYDLTKPPLMRLTLILGNDDNFKIWWRFHHILMDGWAFNVVLMDFFQLYESNYLYNEDPQLSSPLPFREYIAYRKSRDTTREEVFWKKMLQGFESMEPMAIGEPVNEKLKSSVCQGRIELDVSELYAPVQNMVKSHQVTLNSIFHGLFSLHISRHCGDRKDVVTGSTAADRSALLNNSQSGVGLYMNTLPIRTIIEPEMKFIDWIKSFQPIILECFQYAASSEQEIKKWCDLPNDKMIFESNYVFENMPTVKGKTLDLGFELTGYSLESRTHHPLSFFVWPDTDMEIKVIYDKSRFSASNAHLFLKSIENSLERLVDDPSLRVKQVVQ